MHQLISIIGPTASGKSALAMALAQNLKAEILTVDSMTVYTGMDIGTAKPSASDRASITHHGLDLVPHTAEFTVSRFVEYADGIISSAKARNIPLVLVGGTPLYFVSLFKGLFEGPAGNDELRDKLRQIPLPDLHARLTQVDPEAAQRIHVNDEKRLVRALEVFELTGKPITSFQTEWESGTPRHTATWFGMSWDKEELNKRINARSKAMIADGWPEEVARLLKKGSFSKTSGEAAGYTILQDHLRGLLSLDDATEEIKQSTRQLARRQLKWFRRFENVHWLPGIDEPAQILSQALQTVSSLQTSPIRPG